MNNCNIQSAIIKAVRNRDKFYSYCLPNSKKIVFRAEDISSSINRSNQEQFIAHPFSSTNSVKRIVINGDLDEDAFLRLEHKPLPIVSRSNRIEESASHDEYIDQLNNVIKLINRGDISKLVLSNTKIIDKKLSAASISNLFVLLCNKYPSAFVFVYFTTESGLWMGASPETLLQCKNSTVKTMALAGTKVIADESPWMSKEIKEQRYVSDYICSIFNRLKIEHTITSLYTKQAGAIKHLCNDIFANNVSKTKIAELLKLLHPTPALAGIPKATAIETIQHIEKHQRKYYGGYVGPQNTNNGDFSFFVNLRSMNILDDKIILYAGGGITSDSNPESEWEEIANKFDTLLSQISILDSNK